MCSVQKFIALCKGKFRRSFGSCYKLDINRTTPSMRKDDVMVMCSYNNLLNGMIPPDEVNAASQWYGNPSRRWVWFDRKIDFWWQNTYTMSKPEGGRGYKRNWKRKRKRLKTWHKDSKLAPNLRRGNLLLIWNFAF